MDSDSDVSFWSAVSGYSHMSESPAKPGDGGLSEGDLEYFIKKLSYDPDCDYEELISMYDLRMISDYLTKDKLQKIAKTFS